MVNYYKESELSELVGQQADLGRFAYLWRADRTVQDKPEAEFIPRRIARQDKVYRTLLPTLGPDLTKSIYYQQLDLLEQQLPPAKGKLLTGMCWVGGLTDYEISIEWPTSCEAPLLEQIEVRVYPTAFGWFGFSVDRRLENPQISRDGRVWTYCSPKNLQMDFAYNMRVPAATEVVAVFGENTEAIPEIRITGKSLGVWQKSTFMVSWGLDGKLYEFNGLTDAHMALLGEPEMDRANKRATFTCLYSADSRYGCDSRFTIILDEEKKLGATVLLRDLANEPIYVPEMGLLFCPEHKQMTKDEYLAQYPQKSVRDRVKEHGEVTDWKTLFEKVRLWKCPDDTEIGEFPDSSEAGAVFCVPDKRWETMYNLAVEQLRGKHMWGTLAAEVGRTTYVMELIGLHDEADRVYRYFLESPGVKACGDYSTGEGSLERATGMRHDMGYNHEGTHCSTGKILYSMVVQYKITDDKNKLQERLPRLKKAADWIIGQLHGYMQDIPNREKLHAYGLMPPEMLGDYALPCCDWRWYYRDNADAYIGLSQLAKALQSIDDPEAEYYLGEVEWYKKNLLAAIRREALYAPVRKSADGIYRSFIPRIAYGGGLLHYGEETNISHYGLGVIDLFDGALSLGEIDGVLSADDRSLLGTLNAMEEAGLSVSIAALNELEHPTANEFDKLLAEQLKTRSAGSKRTHEPPKGDLWFYNVFANLPKVSHNANVYLRQDDIDNFLHFFLNHAIVMVGANGKMWEHAHPDVFEECQNPDNGTAAWFAENFRNMLLTEDDEVFWLAKGTPREFLQHGKRIEAIGVPSFYGKLSYRIESYIDDGYIVADIQVPTRKTPPMLKLRLRNYGKKAIKSVTVNGEQTECVAADGETLSFVAPTENMQIKICY